MRTRTIALLTALTLATAPLVACGSDEAPSTDSIDAPDDASDAPVDGTWVAASGSTSGTNVVLLAGWDVTITIEDGTVGGRAACNGYGGTARFDDGSVSISEVSMTEMACEPAVMEVEQAFLSALTGFSRYTVTDDALTLTGDGAEWTFTRRPPVPETDVVGTEWVLDTVIEGESATTSPLLSNATLRLNEDGTLTGSTTCRLLEGEWIVAGGEIVFTTFGALDDPAAGGCSGEAQELDGFIVSVLGDGFTAEVDGDRLTVMSTGEQGLSYTAG